MNSPRLVAATQSELLVEYGQFTLQEVDGENALNIEPREHVDDVTGWFASGGPGGVHFWSSANDHYPLVRIENWTSEPPCSQEEWEAVRDETFTVEATGQLGLWELFGGGPPDLIVLPRLGEYRIRVYVRGQHQAAALGDAEFFHAVEHWLLQIWPP